MPLPYSLPRDIWVLIVAHLPFLARLAFSRICSHNRWLSGSHSETMEHLSGTSHSWLSLHSDLWNLIFSWLRYPAREALASTCTRLHKIGWRGGRRLVSTLTLSQLAATLGYGRYPLLGRTESRSLHSACISRIDQCDEYRSSSAPFYSEPDAFFELSHNFSCVSSLFIGHDCDANVNFAHLSRLTSLTFRDEVHSRTLMLPSALMASDIRLSLDLALLPLLPTTCPKQIAHLQTDVRGDWCVPRLASFELLRILEIVYWNTSLPFPTLSQLERLTISLHQPLDLPYLPNLTRLEVFSGLTNTQPFVALERCMRLKRLKVVAPDISALHIASWTSLTNLERLALMDACWYSQVVPEELNGFLSTCSTRLRELRVATALPDLLRHPKLSRLSRLDIHDTSEFLLLHARDFRSLNSVTVLNITSFDLVGTSWNLLHALLQHQVCLTKVCRLHICSIQGDTQPYDPAIIAKVLPCLERLRLDWWESSPPLLPTPLTALRELILAGGWDEVVVDEPTLTTIASSYPKLDVLDIRIHVSVSVDFPVPQQLRRLSCINISGYTAAAEILTLRRLGLPVSPRNFALHQSTHFLAARPMDTPTVRYKLRLQTG